MGPVDGQIPLIAIMGVRPESTNEKIYEETPFAFDVVTTERVHSLGVDTEEDRIRWTTALTVAYNDAIMRQADYKIDTVLHLETTEVTDLLASFRKYVGWSVVGSYLFSQSLAASRCNLLRLALVLFYARLNCF